MFEFQAVIKTVTKVKITKINLTTVSPSDLEILPDMVALDLLQNK